MSEVEGFTTGFDYLRVILAISVLCWHSYPFTMGSPIADAASVGTPGIFIFPIVPMFFALSGFLVAASLLRARNLGVFLWLRAVRLVPALAVEVTLSALVLGPLVTGSPLSEYFSNSLFFKYFLNIFGYIHYHLPGVFLHNPYPGVVNASLWTVPYELECYIALTVLALVTLARRPRILACLFVAFVILKTGYDLGVRGGKSALSPRMLVGFFLSGIIIHLNRDIVPKNGWIALVCGFLGVFLLRSSHFAWFSCIPVAYVTVWLGLLQPRKIPLLMGGDYSYGIYLYAGPIQQSVWQAFDMGKSYYGNIFLSLVFVSVFAAFSWHAIEKPALRLKRIFDRPCAAARGGEGRRMRKQGVG